MHSMIYIDMDGVLAKWDPTSSVEDTFKTGYFAKRAEEKCISCLIKQLVKEGYPVSILSAAYVEGTAMSDKQHWLAAHGLGPEIVPAVFVPYGSPKHTCVPKGKNLLIDDFSKNLHEWESAGYVGIKFYNGINGTQGSWTGYNMNHRQTVKQMSTIVRAVFEDYLANG